MILTGTVSLSDESAVREFDRGRFSLTQDSGRLTALYVGPSTTERN